MAELRFDSHSAQYLTRDKGYRPTVTDKAVTHINFIQGGYRTVLSSSDIANLHFNLVDEGQIIYAISESKTYKISKTHVDFTQGIYAESISYEEFYFPTLTSSFAITASYIDTASYAITASHVLDSSGVGFPYSGSDTITDSDAPIPSAAVITGSLFLSGSGFITASSILLADKLNSVGNIGAFIDGFPVPAGEHTRITDGTIEASEKITSNELIATGSINTLGVAVGGIVHASTFRQRFIPQNSSSVSDRNRFTSDISFVNNNLPSEAGGSKRDIRGAYAISASIISISRDNLADEATGKLYTHELFADDIEVSNNLNISGTLTFDGFNFSDGNISVLSGSNIFGTSSLNTHQFTGSLLVSGGPHLIQGDAKFTGDTQLTGSLSVSGSFSVFEGKPPSNFSSQMFPNPYKIFDVNTNNEETTVYKLQAEGPNHDFRGYEGPVPDNLADIGVTFDKETKVTITGSLDISGSAVGAILINGNPLDFSGVEDQEVFVAHVMINTGDLGDDGFILEDARGFDTTTLKSGNPNNQIAISSSETPAVQLVPGDKVKIKWVYNNVSHSHTTHIFDVKETDSEFNSNPIFASIGTPFEWLSSYQDDNPAANPPYIADYARFDYAANSSMSLHTGITASHWINIVSKSTEDFITANGVIENNVFTGQFAGPGATENPIFTNLFDNPGIINTSWIASNRPGLHQTFKLFKIIPGVPCCNVFGSEITVHGGITTVDGPIRANGELISEQGLIVKVPFNPNFHNPDKYTKDRDLEIPITKILSGGIEPIRINDQGIFKMHNFTGDYEPVPQEGGIMFRNGEMFLGKG